MAQGQVIIEDDGSKRLHGLLRPPSAGKQMKLRKVDTSSGHTVKPMPELAQAAGNHAHPINDSRLNNVRYTLPGNSPQSVDHPSSVEIGFSECVDAACTDPNQARNLTVTVKNEGRKVHVIGPEQFDQVSYQYSPHFPSVIGSVKVNNGIAVTASGTGQANVTVTFEDAP